MKKLLQLFLLLIFIQNISALESKDSLPETKKSIWLGSKFHVEPIYVIDGVPMNVDKFRLLNPYEIVSIEVLKGEEAISLFCNKGANGVVIIKTTKSITRKEKRKLKREKKKATN